MPPLAPIQFWTPHCKSTSNVQNVITKNRAEGRTKPHLNQIHPLPCCRASRSGEVFHRAVPISRAQPSQNSGMQYLTVQTAREDCDMEHEVHPSVIEAITSPYLLVLKDGGGWLWDFLREK